MRVGDRVRDLHGRGGGTEEGGGGVGGRQVHQVLLQGHAGGRRGKDGWVRFV